MAKRYLGRHSLGVNRVTDGRRSGRATIKAVNGRLQLSGRVRKGAHWLAIEGTVKPVSLREFRLVGSISGAPDLSWRNQAPTARKTTGTFVFRAKGGRKYWRMYEVNGRGCVCDDHCGNDFCYIDIGFLNEGTSDAKSIPRVVAQPMSSFHHHRRTVGRVRTRFIPRVSGSSAGRNFGAYRNLLPRS